MVQRIGHKGTITGIENRSAFAKGWELEGDLITEGIWGELCVWGGGISVLYLNCDPYYTTV